MRKNKAEKVGDVIMEQRLKDHLVKWEQIANEVETEKKYTDEDRKELVEEMLTQIGFFQHERLIHLIVTVTFAILAIMSILATLAIEQPALLLLDLLLVVLLFPYIRHYYILENGVQKLYRYYDKIRGKCS